jgi:hypothetical protein
MLEVFRAGPLDKISGCFYARNPILIPFSAILFVAPPIGGVGGGSQ